MRILNRYIGSHVIGSTLIVVFVLMGIESFMEFITQLSDIGKGHYGIVNVLLFVPLQLPSDLYQLFPMMGFLGSLMGLGRLASSSQLIVMRAAGVSIVQIMVSVLRAALLMIIVVTVIGEWFAPQWQRQATHLKAVAIGGNQAHLKSIWLHRGNSYINIGLIQSSSTISDITRFDFDMKDRLTRITYARSGRFVKNEWRIYNIEETDLRGNRLISKTRSSEPLSMDLEPQFLKQVKQSVDQESLFTLFRNILYLEKTGLVTSQYQYAFWKRLIQPVTTIIMICLGIPFIFGSLRSASMGFRIMMGVMIGFGFYMLNQFFGPITLVYQFPPLLAALLPTILFLIAYAILLKRVT